jgi:tetratricopeptide (TPR) repeat protein
MKITMKIPRLFQSFSFERAAFEPIPKKLFFVFALLTALAPLPCAQSRNSGSSPADNPAGAGENTGEAAETAPGGSGFGAQSGLYYVISDRGKDDALAIIKEMEMRFQVFNQVCRYDAAWLEDIYRVRAFNDEESYNAYVSSQLGETRKGAVYLHYTQREKRELVIHRGSPDEKRALPREAFVQFFRGFVGDPPSWMQEGFAVYFGGFRYDEVLEKLEYTENLAWLDSVKDLGKNAPSLEWVLLADVLGRPDNFQSVAWSLVSFFMNTKKEAYYRTLGEVFLTLSDQAAADDNSKYAAQRITAWTDLDVLRQDYAEYLINRKTFNDLLKNGKDAYNAGDYLTADICFSSALNLRPDHYAPYYYLGLLSYKKRDYETTENYYRLSLDRGASLSLISYARGVNAASAGRIDEAVVCLEEAAAVNPAQYRDKADTLIRRLKFSLPF